MSSRFYAVLVSVIFLSVAFVKAEPFKLSDPGTESIVQYGKYGVFIGTGTHNYQYKMVNPAGLKAAVGEGIFPNVVSVLRDPEYKKAKEQNKLEGSPWDFVNNDNFQLNFFKWATLQEDPGVRQYYTALALERAGLYHHAIKAYYAIVVHFPKAVGTTYWNTVWYIGPVALDRIKYLMREHPELGLTIEGAEIRILNSFDIRRGNDVYIINPGRIVKKDPKAKEAPKERVKIDGLDVVKTIGVGNVKLEKYANGHWRLLVDETPFPIRGMAYSPNQVGLSPDDGSLNVSVDWQWSDFNKNGIIDGPFEAFIDKNGNNKRDKGEKPIGDFALMKEMGVNTMRIYHHEGSNKELLKAAYEDYGFMFLVGDFIGMYCTGSNAEWYYGTDYTNPEHKANMLASVKRMVENFKDEPYVLMWVLGNENNYGGPGVPGRDSGSGCRAKIQPEAYYEFVNEAAKLIKSLDPLKRPVAICNGDILYLDICAQKAPEIDVFGANAYRGEQGFGNLWWDVKNAFDRPVLVTEFGCSAHHSRWTRKQAEEAQAKYHEGNILDMDANFAGSGEGNCLGGIVFEWTDEWWKAGPPPQYSAYEQDEIGKFGAPFLDGWSYEEILGITSQGDGSISPFLRQLKPAYHMYKKHWNK